MSITAKTRKILWAKSGNRCAICKRELVIESLEMDGASVIGEECHIVASEINGPRGKYRLPMSDRDNVENLILLCRNHHKMIDDQVSKYTVEVLREIKTAHEKWVRETLATQRSAGVELGFAYRIDTGAQLWSVIESCNGLAFTNDQLKSEDDIHLVGTFLQSLKDYADFADTMEVYDRLIAQQDLGQQIKELDYNELLIYAATKQYKIGSKDANPMTIHAGFFLILRKDNPFVKRKEEEIESVMRITGQMESIFSNFIPINVAPSSVRIGW